MKTNENEKCYALFLKISKERQYNRKTLKTNGRTKFTILRKNICIKKLMRRCAQTISDFRKKFEKFHKISEIFTAVDFVKAAKSTQPSLLLQKGAGTTYSRP